MQKLSVTNIPIYLNKCDELKADKHKNVFSPPFRQSYPGGEKMSRKEKRQADSTDLRIDPEKRLCPKFDSASIALFPVATREEMGVRVVDDCAEEHIM